MITALQGLTNYTTVQIDTRLNITEQLQNNSGMPRRIPLEIRSASVLLRIITHNILTIRSAAYGFQVDTDVSWTHCYWALNDDQRCEQVIPHLILHIVGRKSGP